MEDDDDVPSLSAETFAALQEFYAEQQKRQEIFTKLEADDKLKENVLFDENWVSFVCFCTDQKVFLESNSLKSFLLENTLCHRHLRTDFFHV